AHGSGSDPSHTGFLKRFSNDPGSNASSEGAFLTADYYVGKHGRSQRLIGLDATNDNALSRAIVVHSAWYANPDMIRSHGMLGRSQCCF
ncbi:murein L,D-transpeptidase catalytic domain-containing protein, partial [Enterococcus faecalis]|uniref:murein L,D-transpeptidase catalytic domain-containing protein n=1 Tax=Enterococcus faecalis TaxID=1351 RepID=UPI003D6C081C